MPDVDPQLLDVLSEMLAVEQDGTRLYSESVVDAPENLRPKLLEYAEQSRRGCLVLEEAIRRLGGDPVRVSNGAQMAHRLTDAVLAATESGGPRRWIYRLLHIVAFETRDGMIWDALDALADKAGGTTGEVLHTAATAVLSEEALGAHMADRNDERIAWALEAMEAELGRELGVRMPHGRRHGLHRPR